MSWPCYCTDIPGVALIVSGLREECTRLTSSGWTWTCHSKIFDIVCRFLVSVRIAIGKCLLIRLGLIIQQSTAWGPWNVKLGRIKMVTQKFVLLCIQWDDTLFSPAEAHKQASYASVIHDMVRNRSWRTVPVGSGLVVAHDTDVLRLSHTKKVLHHLQSSSVRDLALVLRIRSFC